MQQEDGCEYIEWYILKAKDISIVLEYSSGSVACEQNKTRYCHGFVGKFTDL